MRESTQSAVANPLHIALLLKPEYRTPGGLARIRTIALTLGIEVTDIGGAAVSGTISAALYQLLFGASAPVAYDIAEPLRDLVESVSVLPK